MVSCASPASIWYVISLYYAFINYLKQIYYSPDVCWRPGIFGANFQLQVKVRSKSLKYHFAFVNFFIFNLVIDNNRKCTRKVKAGYFETDMYYITNYVCILLLIIILAFLLFFILYIYIVSSKLTQIYLIIGSDSVLHVNREIFQVQNLVDCLRQCSYRQGITSSISYNYAYPSSCLHRSQISLPGALFLLQLSQLSLPPVPSFLPLSITLVIPPFIPSFLLSSLPVIVISRSPSGPVLIPSSSASSSSAAGKERRSDTQQQQQNSSSSSSQHPEVVPRLSPCTTEMTKSALRPSYSSFPTSLCHHSHRTLHHSLIFIPFILFDYCFFLFHNNYKVI